MLVHMLKAEESRFSFLQKLFDFSIAFSLWLLIYWYRFNYLPGAESGLLLTFVKGGMALGALTLFAFGGQGLHRSNRMSSRQDELFRLLKGNTLAVVTFVLLSYFFVENKISRSVILAYFITSTPIFILFRLSVRSFLGHLRRRGYNLRHVVLIGHGRAINEYVDNILSFKDAGISILGWVDSNGEAQRYKLSELTLSQVKGRNPDYIVIGYSGEEMRNVDALLKELHNDVIPLVVLPDLTYSFIGLQIDTIAGVPAMVMNQPSFSSTGLALKRSLDILFALSAMAILSPILLVIAIFIKLTSPGPILYMQERVGLDGRKFKMWKFRSMKIDDTNKPGWTVKDDPRRTKFGSFLRSTSLDELPQFWNILMGDMSLVGPRPEQPEYVEKFRHEVPAYMLRHKMKAGLTGWAQVNGWRGDTSLHKRIECDIYYIRNWSILLDLKIILLTVIKGLVNRNAY
jgi:exopolysaccharide biosynthesis polyprenyl glycosylphosphotransferase